MVPKTFPPKFFKNLFGTIILCLELDVMRLRKQLIF
uniref:Uncharacterized protein n=1 Tax=Arundo donax TaxID=35708 RepID=A0A0A8YZG3_ARUDO